MTSLPHWIGTYMMMMGAGVLTAVMLLYVLTPGWLIGKTGTLPGLTGNWISVERVPVTLLGFVLWFSAGGNLQSLWIAVMTTVLGFALDRLDGKVVKHVLVRLVFLPAEMIIKRKGRIVGSLVSLESIAPLTPDNLLWAWYEEKKIQIHRIPRKLGSRRTRKVRTETMIMRQVLLEDWIYRLTPAQTILPMFTIEKSADQVKYPGLTLKLTGWGEIIDPFADKVCFLPIFFYLAWTNHLHWSAALAMIGIDVFGTLIRRPFDTLPGFRFLQRLVGEEKASAYGKTKVAFQLAVLVLIMPDTAGWLTMDGAHYSFLLATGLLWVAALFGILSVLSRLTFWQSISKKLGLTRFNRRFRKVYEHDVTS